jgi:hypothetical protein
MEPDDIVSIPENPTAFNFLQSKLNGLLIFSFTLYIFTLRSFFEGYLCTLISLAI